MPLEKTMAKRAGARKRELAINDVVNLRHFQIVNKGDLVLDIGGGVLEAM